MFYLLCFPQQIIKVLSPLHAFHIMNLRVYNRGGAGERGRELCFYLVRVSARTTKVALRVFYFSFCLFF